MNNKLTAFAKDNTIRVSSLKLANVARSIVNLKASKAVNQLKFSQKRISINVLKVLNAAIANAENNKQLDIDNLFILAKNINTHETINTINLFYNYKYCNIAKPNAGRSKHRNIY